MILVRNVFRLKFGKSREAVALWQEGLGVMRRAGGTRDTRILTDLAGSAYYTLVVEISYESLSDMERGMQGVMNDADWNAWYQRFVPLAESGHREVFTIVGAPIPPSPAADARAQATPGRA